MNINKKQGKINKINEASLLINQSLKNKRIIKGTIQQVTDEYITLIIEKENEKRKHMPIRMRKEESNLYVPRTDAKKIGKLAFLQRYLGKTISFVVTSIEEDANGKVAIASMKEAVNQYFKNVLNFGIENLNDTAIVNVLATGSRFIVVEYNGYVATISDRELSYSEIPNMTQYFREHNYRDFEIVRIDPVLQYLELTRKDLLGDVFHKKVYEEGKYRKSDVLLGRAVGITNDNRLMVEIEPEVIAIAEYPKNVDVNRGDRVSGIVTGINRTKRKIYLSNLSVINQ